MTEAATETPATADSAINESDNASKLDILGVTAIVTAVLLNFPSVTGFLPTVRVGFLYLIGIVVITAAALQYVKDYSDLVKTTTFIFSGLVIVAVACVPGWFLDPLNVIARQHQGDLCRMALQIGMSASVVKQKGDVYDSAGGYQYNCIAYGNGDFKWSTVGDRARLNPIITWTVENDFLFVRGVVREDGSLYGAYKMRL